MSKPDPSRRGYLALFGCVELAVQIFASRSSKGCLLENIEGRKKKKMMISSDDGRSWFVASAGDASDAGDYLRL